MFTISAIPDQDFSSDYVSYKSGDIIIGSYVWIGANVFINPGVTIGDNAVIGANSVVTHDIPANVIAAGAPIKIIREKLKNNENNFINESRYYIIRKKVFNTVKCQK